MIVQPRDIEILTNFARYFLLTSRQIRRLNFPEDKTGRITRRRLLKMLREEYIVKRQVQVVSPLDGTASPVYHLSSKARELLAQYYDDEQLLLKPVSPRQPQHLYHYAAVAETQIVLRDAIAKQCEVTLDRWVNEDEIVNTDETDSAKHFRLYTEVSQGKQIVCAPDAGFLLSYGGDRAVFLLEQDRASYFHRRVSALKSPGYEALLSRKLHRKHFPETTLDFFYVLVVCPTDKRARQLRSAFLTTNQTSVVQRIYRFLSLDEATPENLLFDPIIRCCHRDDRVPMIKRTDHATQPPMNALALQSGL